MLQSASILVSRAPVRATAAPTSKPAFDLSFVRRFFTAVQAALRARADIEHLSPTRQREAAHVWLRTEETRERR